MGLQKGQTNNPNGRPAGTPNKITGEVKEILKDIVSQELEGLPARLEALDDKSRVEALLKMLSLIVPKPQQENEQQMERPIFTGIDLKLEPEPLSEIKKKAEPQNDPA